MTDAGSTKEAADDPWKSGLRRDESYLIASPFVLLLSENKLAFKHVSLFPSVSSVSRPVKRPCLRTLGAAIFCTFPQRSRHDARLSVRLFCCQLQGNLKRKHVDGRCNNVNATVGSQLRRWHIRIWTTSVSAAISSVVWVFFVLCFFFVRRNQKKSNWNLTTQNPRRFSAAEPEWSCHRLLDAERRHTAELHTSSQAGGFYILNNICLSFSSLSVFSRRG